MTVSTMPPSSARPCSACLQRLRSFEGERLGDHGDGERAQFLGERRHHGRGAGAGAAAQAGGDEDHVGAFQQHR